MCWISKNKIKNLVWQKGTSQVFWTWPTCTSLSFNSWWPFGSKILRSIPCHEKIRSGWLPYCNTKPKKVQRECQVNMLKEYVSRTDTETVDVTTCDVNILNNIDYVWLFVCLVFNGTSTQDRSICANNFFKYLQNLRISTKFHVKIWWKKLRNL